MITPQEFCFSPAGNMPACSYFWNHETAPINGGEVLLFIFTFIFVFIFIYQRNRIIYM